MTHIRLFFILSIIVLVVFAIYTNSMTDVLLVASLIANILVIYINADHIKEHKIDNVELQPTLPNLEIKEQMHDGDKSNADYHDQYKKWADQSFKYEPEEISSAVPDAAPTTSIDVANTVMARKRSRDKQCIDGMITKTADFYIKYYGNDFIESENKPWWGRNEY